MWWRVIGVGGAGMEDVRVAEELDVADLQDHVQRQPQARVLEDLDGALLDVGERRDQTGLGEAGQRFDVVRVEFGVHAAVGGGFEVEDGLFGPLLLPHGDFAFAVEVPDRLGEEVDDVRVFPLERIEDVVRADDVALAALEGAGHAQQADDVAVVGVEELSGGGAVDADFVDLCRIGAGVLLMEGISMEKLKVKQKAYNISNLP